MRSWIFQGNPDKFKIDKFLSDFENIDWSVRQKHFSDQIAVGDEVFIWRASGRKKAVSGVVARGIVTSEPKMVKDDNPREYWIIEPRGVELRVKIRFTDKLLGAKQTIKREWLKEDPVLQNHRIFKVPNQTNYSLTSQEAKRLRALCARTGIDWTRSEALAGLWLYQLTLQQSISRSPDSLVATVANLIGRSVGGVYNKIMNFRAIDPRDERAGLPASSETDKKVWQEFYDETSKSLNANRLEAEFNRVWRQELLNPSDEEDEYQQEVVPTEKDLEQLRGKPPEKTKAPAQKKSISKAPPRDPSVGELALENAGYICEVNGSHTTFMRGDGNQFMEKHHLIPMEFYYDFDRSIDHRCNIVSLCPTCHRMIHLGTPDDRKTLLAVLLPSRIEELKKYYEVSGKIVMGYYNVS